MLIMIGWLLNFLWELFDDKSSIFIVLINSDIATAQVALIIFSNIFIDVYMSRGFLLIPLSAL